MPQYQFKREDVQMESQEGAELFIEFCEAYANRMFTARGKIAPTYICLHQSDLKTLTRLERPVIAVFDYDDMPSWVPGFGTGNTKDIFAELMRKSNGILKAAGSAFISETWYVESPSTPINKALYEHFRGNLGKHPHRREMLFINIEHTFWSEAGSRPRFAEIVRDAANRPTLGKWSDNGAQAGVSGRFSGLMDAAPVDFEIPDMGIGTTIFPISR